jgi:hypothetical protein
MWIAKVHLYRWQHGLRHSLLTPKGSSDPRFPKELANQIRDPIFDCKPTHCVVPSISEKCRPAVDLAIFEDFSAPLSP